MKNVLTVILTCLMVGVYAQKDVAFFDPKEAFNKASELLSEDKKDEAVQLLKKIEVNDSIYMSSLISEMYIYMIDDDFDKAIAIADANIGRDYNYDYYFLLNKSVSLLRQEHFDQAIHVLTEMRKRYPYNHLVEFNMGVCYEKQERYDDAVAAYQRCITLNPYYASAHLNLGRMCYIEDKLAQAMLCYNTYLMINPTSDNALANLSRLNKMVSEKNDSEAVGVASIEDNHMYDEIDLLLKNYVSLNKKYKLKNKVRLPFVKQNHFLLSNLSDIEGDGSFWDEKYLQFYKALMKEGHFDGFIYRITAAASSDKYVKIVDKNMKKIDAYIDWAASEWSDVVSMNNVNIEGNKEKRFWYSNEGKLFAVGDADDQKNSQGSWCFYGKNGELTTKANFKDDKREGRWEWYYANDTLKECSHYLAGKLEGESKSFYDNGQLFVHSYYKNDSLHGKYFKYNKFGALIESSTYKNGKLQGEAKTYHSLGENYPYYSIRYKDGEPHGEVLKYFDSGEVEMKMSFDEGTTLSEVHFFRNGTVDVEYTYSEGELNGPFNSYFYTGKLYEEGEYLNGKRYGKWKVYYRDGVLKSEREYDKEGLLVNDYKSYDRSGNPTVFYQYKRGDIKAYTFYDKDGAVIKEAAKKNGKFFYEGYSSLGVKDIEGNYLFEGGKDGKWLYYSDYGVIREEESYVDGELDGWNIEYYKDGKTVAGKSLFDKDQKYRTNEVFYENGSLLKSMVLYDEEPYRYLYRYFLNGEISSKEYFWNGELHGVQDYYAVESHLSDRYYYDNGVLYAYVHFDKEGNVIDSLNYYKLTDYELHYPNKQLRVKGVYQSGKAHGEFLTYYLNGNVFRKANFFNGKEHGAWEWYHENKQLSKKGAYEHGKKHGEWRKYNKEGVLVDVSYYEYGELQGENKSYADNGVLTFKGTYLDDMRHGLFYYYSDDEELQMVRRYEYGLLTAYSYPDKDGKLVAEIPVEKGTANIVCRYRCGKEARTFNVVNGVFDGAYKKYYASGQLCEVDNYIFGENHGENIEYYKNGKVKLKRHFVCGYLDGEEVAYYENGNVKHEKTYVNGTLTGEVKYYNKQGQLTKVVEYVDGDQTNETVL